jgi:folate-binding protein YgfZ
MTAAPGRTPAPDPAQYDALRHGVGAFPLARDVLEVSGPDAGSYLDGQCSQDLTGLAPGDATWSLVLEPDGKLCALVAVARLEESRYLLATEAGFGEALAARLSRFKLRTKADINSLSWEAVAVRGDGAVPPPDPSGVVVVPVSVNGWPGFDLLGADPGASVPADALWCDPPAWDACRIEAGVPVMGRELDERTIPQEAGLVPWTVSLTKGCYTGQELVARLDARGNRVARRLCAVVLDGASDLEPSSLEGAVLVAQDKEAGVVTSTAWCPAVEGVAGLAMVRRAVAVDAEVDVQLRDGAVERARVAAVPLLGT